MDALTLVIWEKAASVVVVLYGLASVRGWRRKERKLLGWKKIDTEGRNIARHKMNGARADLISSVTSPILDGHGYRPMQQYVDDAMPASDHVCYMLLLLYLEKKRQILITCTNLICQRMQSKRKQQQHQ